MDILIFGTQSTATVTDTFIFDTQPTAKVMDSLISGTQSTAKVTDTLIFDKQPTAKVIHILIFDTQPTAKIMVFFFPPNQLQPKPSPVHSAVGCLRIKNRTLQPPTGMQELTTKLPKSWSASIQAPRSDTQRRQRGSHKDRTHFTNFQTKARLTVADTSLYTFEGDCGAGGR